MTTTVYAQNPQLILPSDEDGNRMNFSRNVGADSPDSYLHLVLPANQINILNPGRVVESQVSDDNMYVEIGCKIFHINHIK